MAGDNAIVVAMVVAGLPREQRGRIMILGIAVATVLRIIFALLTVYLLQIIGLMLLGGLLLLWVCWKLWSDLQEQAQKSLVTEGMDASSGSQLSEDSTSPRKTVWQAIIQIVIADVSMSLDNVLAVAGVARDYVWVLVVGLVLSIAFMGLAAMYIAKLLARHHWIGYVGLAVIFYVALSMIYEGGMQVWNVLI
jgi:YjbE family integral membrane protein